MEKPLNRILKYSFCLLLSFIITVSGNCIENEPAKIKVVATTTHIASLVFEIGKNKVEVITLVPGSMCPGNFDYDPGTMKKIARSKLLINHVWEKWVVNLLNKIDNKGILNKPAATPGNWMIAEINIKAAPEIAAILAVSDIPDKEYYQKNLKNYIKKVEFLSAGIRKTANYKGIKVICSEQQKDFLVWLGFDIIKTYGRPEDLNIREMANIMNIAKKEKVRLVVDNLQNGENTGLQIAKDLKVSHITLSNFPFNSSYCETLQQNMKSIEKAMHESDSRAE